MLPPPLLKSVILIITSSYILILEMMQVLRHQSLQHAWIEKAESFAREQTKASTSPTLAKWRGGLELPHEQKFQTDTMPSNGKLIC